jgi:ribulose-5-phosphate 4-epimerase/fuculose-1-phosphate aldolase
LTAHPGRPKVDLRHRPDGGGARAGANEEVAVSTTTETPVGGRAAWAPRVMPPVGIDLTVPQALAAAFRILSAGGFSENIAGHITVRDDESGNLWVNPWGLWWDEVTASDICVVTPDAEVVGGKWDVTPAIHIHTELHRRRGDAAVVVHNHPYHSTVLAALGMLPDVFHQTGCIFEGELAFVDEYTGEVANAALGADLASRIGDASVVVLANHGVIVTAATIEEATYKSAAVDRQCRLAFDVLLGSGAGRAATTVAPELRAAMKASLLERAAEVFWNGWIRRLLREQPETFA